MISKKKIIISLVIFQLFVIVSGIQVWGATNQPDELWTKAVQLASRNQDLIPGKLYELTQELSNSGNVKSTSESWSRFFETEDGQVQTELLKQLKNGKDVTSLQKETRKSQNVLNYNSDLADFILPFNPQMQSNVTIQRFEQPEMKDNQQCFVYDFRCATPKGDTMVGKAWLNETGIPVAINYTFTPLSKRLSKQIFYLTHEVHFKYESNDFWYPEKIHIELKIKRWFSTSVFHLDSTFSDYWKSKAAEIMTSGKPTMNQDLECIIPFEYIGGYIFVNLRINDRKNYRFLFDTGAATTVLNPNTARELNLKTNLTTEISDGFTSKNADLVVIEKLNLGEATVENSGAMIFDFGKLESDGIKVDGILGANFLRFFIVKIDYSNQKLTFTRKADNFSKEMSQGYKVALSQGATGLIYVPLKIPRIQDALNVEIDTGSSGNLNVGLNFIDQFKPALNCKPVKSKGVVSGGAFSGSEGILSRIDEFTIGDLSIKNLLVTFDNRNGMLLLGNAFWSKFTVTINYLQNEIYLLPLENQKMDTNYMIWGLNISKNEKGQSRISMIWENSAADQAGLQVGDIVLQITAGDESATSYEECMKLMDKYNTIHLFVKRGVKEKEVIITKSFLLPEVK